VQWVATGNFGSAVEMWNPSPACSAVNLRNSTSSFSFVQLCVAHLAVFYDSVPLGGIIQHAERGIRVLREWQSGRAGDYGSWITFGTAALWRLLCAAPALEAYEGRHRLVLASWSTPLCRLAQNSESGQRCSIK
jgi:hypothetical protein